jgi:hypothetical protein
MEPTGGTNRRRPLVQVTDVAGTTRYWLPFQLETERAQMLTMTLLFSRRQFQTIGETWPHPFSSFEPLHFREKQAPAVPNESPLF